MESLSIVVLPFRERQRDTMDSGPSIDQSPLIGDDEHNAGNTNAIIHQNGLHEESTFSANAYNHAPDPCVGGSTKLYLSDLSQIFSVKFLSLMAIFGFFISGGSYFLVTVISLPLFRQMGIGASRQQLYTSMLRAPRAMKPFIGVVSDLFPVLCYNKRYYAMFAILIGISASLVLLKTYPRVDIVMQEGSNDVPGSAETIADQIIVPCFVAITYVRRSSVLGCFGNCYDDACDAITQLLSIFVCVRSYLQQLTSWHRESMPRLCAITQVWEHPLPPSSYFVVALVEPLSRATWGHCLTR